MPEDHAFGGGDIAIAGTDDFIDCGDGFGAVSECGDCLCTADGEYAVDSRQCRRRQHRRIEFAAGGGHRHDNFIDSRNFGGNCIHQHRRRIRRFAAGPIDADARQWRYPLSQARAVGFGELPRLALRALQFMAMPAFDAARGGAQCRDNVGWQ